MHDHQQWTAMYVGSLAARMTTTGNGDGWKWWCSGCSRKDTISPDHAGIGKWAQLTWNWCIPETTASVGLAALVWCANTDKIDVSVWRRHWAPTEVDWAETQEVLRVYMVYKAKVCNANALFSKAVGMRQHGSPSSKVSKITQNVLHAT